MFHQGTCSAAEGGAEGGRVRVAVALVVRQGRAGSWLLIDRRFPAAHLPDLWEFPGGKIRPGETGAECARREVAEETGILVDVRGCVATCPYDYADRRVLLEFHVCEYRSGVPLPLGCRAVRWVRPEHLECYPFPVANAPILERLRAGKWL